MDLLRASTYSKFVQEKKLSILPLHLLALLWGPGAYGVYKCKNAKMQKAFFERPKNRRPRSKADFHPELHCGRGIFIRGDHHLELERFILYFQGFEKT